MKSNFESPHPSGALPLDPVREPQNPVISLVPPHIVALWTGKKTAVIGETAVKGVNITKKKQNLVILLPELVAMIARSL